MAAIPLDPIERTEQLATYACREASTLLQTDNLTKAQSQMCADYCREHADACKQMTANSLDRAWLAQYKLWESVAKEWEDLKEWLE